MSRHSSPRLPIRRGNRSGFSLIELVIVVVIIGIIAAIAIPRMSRGSEGAADAALQQNLSLLRNAIDMYEQEHNGKKPEFTKFKDQMLGYSDLNGNTSATKTTTHYLGPYLRSIPNATVGNNKGQNGVASADPTAADTVTAWVYTESNGNIKAWTPGVTNDATGRAYASY